MIEYKIENDLGVDEFREILISSGLAERRPAGDRERLEKMVEYANLIITARDCGKLVGVARSLSDYTFCTYLSDLAVAIDYQKKGIGKKLIGMTRSAAPQAKIILLAAPAAIDYYAKIGMEKSDRCFCLDELNELR